MATRILSDEDMAEARRLYEREGWGYGRLAAKYGVTKPAVQGWARRGEWQRGIGVAPKGNAATEAKAEEIGQANLTGLQKIWRGEQGMHTGMDQNPALSASVERSTTPAPSAPAPIPTEGRPSCLYALPPLPENVEPDSLAAHDFYRVAGQAVMRRQIEGHAAELAALRNDFVREMRATGKEGAAAAARRHKELTLATDKRHKLEAENLAAWLKNELGGLGVALGAAEVRLVVVFSADSPLTPRRNEFAGAEMQQAAAIMSKESRLRAARAAGEVIDVETT